MSGIGVSDAPRKRRPQLSPLQRCAFFAASWARTRAIEEFIAPDDDELDGVHLSKAPDGTVFIEAMDLYRAESQDTWPGGFHTDTTQQKWWKEPPKADESVKWPNKVAGHQPKRAERAEPADADDEPKPLPLVFNRATLPITTDEEWERLHKEWLFKGYIARLIGIGLWPVEELKLHITYLGEMFSCELLFVPTGERRLSTYPTNTDPSIVAAAINLWASNLSSNLLAKKITRTEQRRRRPRPHRLRFRTPEETKAIVERNAEKKKLKG
jgi:hypothetical protein